MTYFTKKVLLPYIIGALVILIEFVLPVFLVLGLFTRLSAAAVLIVMAGIIATVQNQYFFMNWFGTQKGEGMEFFLLVIGLCLVCILNGGGRFALDHRLNDTGQ
ncbi:MAG: DoxX family protein [Mucilaginibacter sp.]